MATAQLADYDFFPLNQIPPKALFTDVWPFWEHYRMARFHDYANQSSRILAEPIPLARTVRGGDIIDWQGLTIRVMETPGYTRGAVSYLFEIDGKRIACVGDLIRPNTMRRAHRNHIDGMPTFVQVASNPAPLIAMFSGPAVTGL